MKTKRRKGFTLVELLTVISIIAMLLAILVPALNKARITAKNVDQKAQLHSISVALDMFEGENGIYPSSTVKPVAVATGFPGAVPYTVGAQYLAEALAGRDMLGFDPLTTWDAHADRANKDIYASVSIKASAIAQETASLARRKGPYLSQQNIEAFEMGQLYTDTTIGTGNVYNSLTASPKAPAPVLTDVFRTKNVVINGKTVMAGSPILYFKANASATGTVANPERIFPLDADMPSSYPEFYGYIYNYVDNEELIKLGTTKNQTIKHKYDDADPVPVDPARVGSRVFYDNIKNQKITSQPRPYNTDTYLLISAGYDGVYGTKDDIANFGD